MAQAGYEGILGIQLVDDQLRIVEGRKVQDEAFEITHIAQGRTRNPFNFEALIDPNMPRRFAEDITRLCESQSFDSTKVAFSLDSRMVLLKKLAMDAGLEESLVEEQIGWEVKQFATSSPDDYVVDFGKLENGDGDNFKDMLIVVVRKRIIRFLKAVFKYTDLQLGSVDVDVFSAQRALHLNYDYQGDQKICLINIEEQKLHFSIMKGRNFFLAQDVNVGQNNGNLDISIESRTRLISKELRRIMLDNQLGKGVEDLNEIYLYGEAVEDGVVESLQNSYNVKINRADPFRKVKIVAEAKDEIGESHSERYMISVGAALGAIH